MRSFILLIIISNFLIAQNKLTLIDDFENLDNWKTINSEGAEISISSSNGIVGKCIRIDYNFKYGTGYCGIQRKLYLNLPENYRFTFFIKAISPNNNFEIKFLDSTRENVWWKNNINFEFPSNWEKFSVRKRNIHFAWGSTQNKDFKNFSYLEFTIASFNGGSGTIFLDEVKLEEVGDTDQIELKVYPEIKALIDNDQKTQFTTSQKKISFLFDFGKLHEISGLKINWGNNYKKDLVVYESIDSINWNKILDIKGISKKNSYFQFKEIETRFLRFEITSNQNIKISDIKFFDYQFAESKNNIFFDFAQSNYSKYLPRYFKKESSFWTIAGMVEDNREALIDLDGMVEVDNNQFSILPFIELNKKILTHYNFSVDQKLQDEYLPLPLVEWNSKTLKLVIQAFSWGIPNKSSKLFVEYRLINQSKKKLNGKLHLALLPFNVNPYYQSFINSGGVSKIDSICFNKNSFIINGKRLLSNFIENRKISFDFVTNDAISALVENNFDGKEFSNDKYGLNSGLQSFSFILGAKDTIYFRLIYDYYDTFSQPLTKKDFDDYFIKEKEECLNFWKSILNSTELNGSKDVEKLFKIVRSNLAYILINKDGTGIQPGSRTYERSWIRDGSLTSTALLRFGFDYDVKNFIRWYSKYIYENGKVPCVVDKRGPDPIPENDSYGQFLYLLHTYFQFKKDTSFLKEYFPAVIKVVNYIDSLTSLRKTKQYKSDSLSAFYGLITESISHEGYANPVHSYWDDFFTIRGLNDAVSIASVLGENEYYLKFKNIRNNFQGNIINSIQKTIKKFNINYIPGCVELGDFDPTSTSIALFPCNQMNYLPLFELKNTYDKYYDFIFRREVQNDFLSFTPYEIRNINSYLLLNQKNRAFKLLNFMLRYQRPSNWNHWAEVVWRDSTFPGYIGDMPHTWVGSDFINAFRNMFLYEDEVDSSLKILMGFSESFLNQQNYFELKNFRSIFGSLNLKVQKVNEKQFNIDLSGEMNLNGWKIYIYNPGSKNLSSVFINNKEIFDFNNQRIEVTEFPSKIIIKTE